MPAALGQNIDAFGAHQPTGTRGMLLKAKPRQSPEQKNREPTKPAEDQIPAKGKAVWFQTCRNSTAESKKATSLGSMAF